MQDYQDSKAAELDGELREYLLGAGADWARHALPSGVRDAAVELVNALVSSCNPINVCHCYQRLGRYSHTAAGCS